MINFDFNTLLNKPELKKVLIGELNLPSGTVCLTDPLSNPLIYCLNKSFKPGKFPVHAYITSENKLAFVLLSFINTKAENWEDAELKGQSSMLSERSYIYNPDGKGLSALLDPLASEVYFDYQFQQDIMKNPDYANYVEEIKGEHIKAGELYFEHIIDKEKDLNSIFFIGGEGLGRDFAYWGYDKDGNIVSLLVDLQIVE